MSDRQLEFFTTLYDEGERTGQKANPAKVAQTMRNLQNQDGTRKFTPRTAHKESDQFFSTASQQGKERQVK